MIYIYSSLLIFSIVWSSLLSKLSIELFSSFYSSTLGFFLIVSVSLLNFLYCSCTVFLVSFSCPCFKRVILNSL